MEFGETDKAGVGERHRLIAVAAYELTAGPSSLSTERAMLITPRSINANNGSVSQPWRAECARLRRARVRR